MSILPRALTRALALGMLAAAFVLGSHAGAATESVPRGGRVGWARLKTPGPHWNRHAAADGVLSDFIRTQTSLNIDPTWYTADPARLDDLARYPLLFANNAAEIAQPQQRKNLGEYLRRGGFLFVDACSNTSVTPDPDRFIREHTALLAEVIPGVEVRALPPTHPIYRTLFLMRETPPHVYMQNVYDAKWARHGLYGGFAGDRMVALLSVSGLQCGWDHKSTARDAEECMKMVVNIYVYAMTR